MTSRTLAEPGLVTFGWYAPLAVEGVGVVPLADYPRFDNRYLQVDFDATATRFRRRLRALSTSTPTRARRQRRRSKGRGLCATRSPGHAVRGDQPVHPEPS
jgi:hypothetical protein